MRPVRLLFVVVFSFASVNALHGWTSAQEPAAGQPPPAQGRQGGSPPAGARQSSPAAKALSDANAIKDADQKIKALRKVVADFAGSPQAEQANTALLDALIKKGDKTAIAEQARAMVVAADETTRVRTQREVAGALLKADILLAEAESYAKAAVENFPDEKGYAEARRREAAARAASRAAGNAGSGAAAGGSAAGGAATGAAASGAGGASSAPSGADTGAAGASSPASSASDEALATRYKSDKQAAVSTLGQIYAKRGNRLQAAQVLRDAYLIDRKSAAGATAALKLAEYAKADGLDAEQLDYLSSVALAGRLTPEAYAELHAVYAKLHGGSLDGLEEALDSRYEEEGPKPPPAERYERADDRSDRLVLAEIFTGAGCPPCVAADLAFESAMHRYGAGDLAVLMYHMHVPRPDPMTNPYTQARSQYYKVTGVPTYVIDGEAKVGGGTADNAAPLYRKNVEPVVDRRLSVKSDARLALKASATGKTVQASVSVEPAQAKAAGLRLHLVLVEERIRYSGENGIRFHPMVVRAMASTGVEPPKPAAQADAAADAEDAPAARPATPGLPVPVLGFPLEPGKAKTVEYTFDLGKVEADGLANLEDLEQHSSRYPNYKFVEKKHELNRERLLLVAFVQDEDSKQILQAAQVAVN